jgi:hypothetical protein
MFRTKLFCCTNLLNIYLNSSKNVLKVMSWLFSFLPLVTSA